MDFPCDVAIIGGGVVGCALAENLGSSGIKVAVIERHDSLGLDQSTHNSGVIHAGYLVPSGTLKSKLCVEGNRMLYSLCLKRGIPHRNTGCLVVAKGDGEEAYLEKLLQRGAESGVGGLAKVGPEKAASLASGLSVSQALHSQTVGIIDAGALLRSFESQARQYGVKFFTGFEISEITAQPSGFRLYSEKGAFSCRVAVNCAGLHADSIAGLLGLQHTIYPVKGEYCYLSGISTSLPVYPALHDPAYPGKGVHLTPTIDGRMLVGPTAKYVESKDDYSLGSMNMKEMEEGLRYFFPDAQNLELSPAFCGVRAKLSRQGEGEKDFIIREESANGVPGFVNLVGMESPGLTSSPAIAAYASELVKGALRNSR